ncbi:hypothetical protein ACFQ1S_20155, partial [Kibdelosporangium lantanae]
MANNIDHRQVRPIGSVTTGRSTEGGLGIALVDSVPLVREGLSALVMRTPYCNIRNGNRLFEHDAQRRQITGMAHVGQVSVRGQRHT